MTFTIFSGKFGPDKMVDYFWLTVTIFELSIFHQVKSHRHRKYLPSVCKYQL